MRFHRLAVATLIAFAAAAGAARADIATDEPRLERRSVGTLDGDSAISYTADTPDRAVAERVMDALANEPALEGAAITVLVDEGQVRLSGTARDEDQAAYALELAQDAAGPAVAVSAESLQPGTGAY
jgi:hyperosmotically inducible periplasmic protein